MRLKKKALLSASLAAVMTATSIAVPLTVNAVGMGEEGNLNTAYNLADSVGEGNILHAFNWYFNDVKRYMKDIAAAGYTSVQVSPVQGNKGTINVGTYALDWWATYQPINFAIGNNYGTRDEFKAMCDEAEKYGVKIVVDIVANHMSQSGSLRPGVSPIDPQVDADLREDPDCWHTEKASVTDSNRYAMTQGTLSGLPDLNTSNEKVQNYVKSLLKDCIDCGADGFRFDAAKHIELDTDPDVRGVHYASDFWKNITSYARELKPDIFMYGEVLYPFGYGTDASGYTKYISITDSNYGGTVRSAANGSNTSSLTKFTFPKEDPKNLVLWVESHDTYTAQQSSTLTDEKIILGWGIIGARKDSPSLYLVRPEHDSVTGGSGGIAYDELMGGPGKLVWKDPTVVAVNQLKNAYVGESETLYSNAKAFFVQRGDDAMVMTNCDSADLTLNLKTTMKDGIYKDVVNGNEYNVSGGVLTGTVPAKSVIVLNSRQTSAPEVTISMDEKVISSTDETLYFTGDTLNFSFDCTDASAKGTIVCCDAAGNVVDETEINSTSGGDVSIPAPVEVGQEATIVVSATNASGNTCTQYKIMRKDPDANCVAYFDMTGQEDWDSKNAPGVFCYAKKADGTALTEFPGYQMERIIGTTYVKYEFAEKNGIVKFSEGPVSTGLDGRTIPATVVNYGSAVEPANREQGGLPITGSMLWTKGMWKNYTFTTASDNACTPYSYGDVNGDGEIKLEDAILADKQCLNLTQLSTKEAYSADIDGDYEVKLIDAIEIQKYALGIR